MHFFLKKAIDSQASDIRSIARNNKVSSQKLSRIYRKKLSDFEPYLKFHSENFEKGCFVFPENIGENMAIDETGLFGGELYTILYNKEKKGKKGSLAAIIKGTKANLISDAIRAETPITTLMNIKEITLDLSNSMDWICREIAPNARKTYDRFHVEKILTDALQQIRIKYRWEAIDRENKLRKDDTLNRLPRYANGDSEKQLLARSRTLLYKKRTDWTEQQRERARILFEEFPLLEKAYEYYMEFKKAYNMNLLTAEHYLYRWVKRVKKCGIETMMIAARTIERNLGGILNYLANRSTNASIENFNRKLKSLLERVRGVSDKNMFLYRIIQIYA